MRTRIASASTTLLLLAGVVEISSMGCAPLPDDCSVNDTCPPPDGGEADQFTPTPEGGAPDVVSQPEGGPGEAGNPDGGEEAGFSCDAGLAACSGACVDTTSDNANCGACGKACTTQHGTSTCKQSACSATCDVNYHACNGQCLSDGDDPSTDPCLAADAFGVFVVAGATGTGTQASPLGAIEPAMALAKSSSKGRVFVCALTPFATGLTVGAGDDGVKVYGGFTACPASGAWTYTAGTNTVVAPTAAGPALSISGLKAGVVFQSFEFDAQPAAPMSGGSVVGVLVNGSSNVSFAGVTINAGDAAGGAPGATTPNYTAPQALAGNPASGAGAGNPHVCACATPAGSFSQGGRGGAGDLSAPTAGGSGASKPAVSAPAQNGGSAQTATSACGPGTSGVGGADGTGGAPTTVTVALATTGVSESGGVGGSGSVADPAQGGGGGGGGMETVLADGGTTGGGGGGGCGGCGGGYGTGGSPGGTSVALASVNSTVSLSACTLTAGAGGIGGSGGDGQTGQAGGGSGAGSSPGCVGGLGGQGGHGGGGAGGAGGSSIGIAYTGTVPSVSADTHVNTKSAGTGGAGGAGGSAQQGNAGSANAGPVAL